jgi:hypothetical protein
VADIFKGYSYNQYRRPYRNSQTSIQALVYISDQFTKLESVFSLVEASLQLYYCVDSSRIVKETCYESIEDDTTAVAVGGSEDDEGFSVSDGVCCEDRSTAQAVCCVVDINRALSLKFVFFFL